jgi:GWxTD domain-containing protein
LSFRIYAIIAILLAASITTGWAQSENESDFDLYLDCARFQAEENMTFVEIYYAFNRDSVQHKSVGNKLIATYKSVLEISTNDSVIKTVEWKREDIINSRSEISPNQMISDVYPILLSEGEFKLHMELIDLSGSKRAFNELNFIIDPYPEDSLSMSDIQIGININRSLEQNRFVKNGWSVVANPSNVYNLNWPVLYYYCEIYNLRNPGDEDEAKYNIISTIKDINGQIIKKIPAKSKKIENKSVVEINKTVVSSLTSGVYELTLEVVNLATKETAQRTKQFYVYRQADFAKSESDQPKSKDNLYLIFLTKTEEELDQEFEYATYISNSNEEEVYEDLNLEGKRKFLANFWDMKNNSVDQTAQMFRENYLNLVMQANNTYTSSGTVGWKSHRGRVLIKYGEPDDIERNYGGAAPKDNEKWTYHLLQGGIYFIFVDVSGYGAFRLVHSNARDEVYDRNWEARYLR